jgi:hypothetical protein
MPFVLWCSLDQTETEFRARKPIRISASRATLDDALREAMAKMGDGQSICWEIEGPDGFVMNRQQITDEIRRRRDDLLSSPMTKY